MKPDKDEFNLALDLFIKSYTSEKEFVEDKGKKIGIAFDYHLAFQEQELFRKLADEVFAYLDNYPELKQELKDKYYN